MRNMEDKLKNTLNDELFETILGLSSLEECYAFFEDLCTLKEIEAMAQRLRAAKLLSEGKTYEQIIGETDISSATLSRVSKCLQYGEGYRAVLARESGKKNFSKTKKK